MKRRCFSRGNVGSHKTLAESEVVSEGSKGGACSFAEPRFVQRRRARRSSCGDLHDGMSGLDGAPKGWRSKTSPSPPQTAATQELLSTIQPWRWVSHTKQEVHGGARVQLGPWWGLFYCCAAVWVPVRVVALVASAHPAADTCVP